MCAMRDSTATGAKTESHESDFSHGLLDYGPQDFEAGYWFIFQELNGDTIIMEADNLPEIGEDEDFEDEDALGPPNFFSFTYAEFKEFFGTSDQVEVKV